MLTTEQIQQIELYYADMLSPAERAELEHTVFLDPELKIEAEGIIDILDGFAALELDTFENQLQSWEQKYDTQKHKETPQETPLLVSSKKETKTISMTAFITKHRFAAAAVLFMLFLPLGYIAFQQFSGPSIEQIYASNFEHYNSFNVVTRAAQPAPSAGEDPKKQQEIAMQVLLNQGINAYNAHAYKEATTHLSNYLKVANDEKNLDEVQFYLAISQLYDNSITSAKTIFESLVENSKIKSYKDGSEWYLALALLKENNVKGSVKMLKQIAGKPKHRYQEKAEKLLPQVKKLDK